MNNLNRKVKARLQIRAEQIERIRELTANVDPQLEGTVAGLKIEELLGESFNSFNVVVTTK